MCTSSFEAHARWFLCFYFFLLKKNVIESLAMELLEFGLTETSSLLCTRGVDCPIALSRLLARYMLGSRYMLSLLLVSILGRPLLVATFPFPCAVSSQVVPFFVSYNARRYIHTLLRAKVTYQYRKFILLKMILVVYKVKFI